MIMPYSSVSWLRIEAMRVRRVDPADAVSPSGSPPLSDLADRAPIVRPDEDRLELSGEALRLLAAYELSRIARNTP